MTLHEVLDDAVEFGALVAKSRLTNGQSPEILNGLGDGLLLRDNFQIPRKCRSVQGDAYTTEKPNNNWIRAGS